MISTLGHTFTLYIGAKEAKSISGAASRTELGLMPPSRSVGQYNADGGRGADSHRGALTARCLVAEIVPGMIADTGKTVPHDRGGAAMHGTVWRRWRSPRNDQHGWDDAQ
jgi:hypothetical protein